MKVWQRSTKKSDFGKVLLIWHHRAVSRFSSKIFSWLLGGFVLGLLASILFNAIGLGDYSIVAGRVTFFVVFIAGVIGALLHNLIHGLQYRITANALLYIRPVCALEGSAGTAEKLKLCDRVEFIPWDEVKSVDESNGILILNMKDGAQVSVGIAPVLALHTPTADGGMEKRSSAAGVWKTNQQLDKESIKLVVQKIRDIKKTTTSKT
jgi:hypothetical protein